MLLKPETWLLVLSWLLVALVALVLVGLLAGVDWLAGGSCLGSILLAAFLGLFRMFRR